jgi:Agrobacterium tumefaciens protein Atu4866
MTLAALMRLTLRLLTAAAIAAAVAIGLVDTSVSQSKDTQMMAKTHAFVGMWVTRDGYVRHELLANNRYDEARGNRKSAYQGRYTITGNRIDHVDDTGFTADGDFIDGILHHAGMVLYRAR